MRFVTSQSFTSRSLGTNIEAANFSNAEPVYYNTANSTKNADGTTYKNSAELDLGQIKNVDNSDVATNSFMDNTMILTFKVVLEDSIYVKNLTNYSIVVGMKNSEQSVWVSELSFTASLPLERRPRVKIVPSSNGSVNLVQG